jgi:hypothetical protein
MDGGDCLALETRRHSIDIQEACGHSEEETDDGQPGADPEIPITQVSQPPADDQGSDELNADPRSEGKPFPEIVWLFVQLAVSEKSGALKQNPAEMSRICLLVFYMKRGDRVYGVARNSAEC